MENLLRVTLLQLDIQWGDAQENMRRAGRLMDDAGVSDLYVLPEMWSTGFATCPEGLAHDAGRNAGLEWMRRMAAERHCAVCGSLSVRELDGSYRNRHYFVDGRADRVWHYDKRHLFSHGGEDRYYTAGSEPCVVSYGGWRILLLTCYDLRFPVWCRYGRGGMDYDMIVLVANWPVSRQPAWQILTRARAIENQSYFVGVNRVGDDACSHYAGMSCVVDAVGRCVCQCRRDAEECVSAVVSLDELERRRGRFRVLDDRD